MNELCDSEISAEELTPKLKELALKFNLPKQVLLDAIAEERRERLSQLNRKKTHWIWKSVELYNGVDGLKDSLNAKWQNINIVCTLLLTITIPLGLSPPVSYFSNAQPNSFYKLFQTLMFISSIFSLAGIVSNTLWIDMINTFCPRQSDVLFYVNCGAFDFPFQMMLGCLASAIAGFVILMHENSDMYTYAASLIVGFMITVFFVYHLVILAIPIIIRNRKLIAPFERACKWCNINESSIERSSEFSDNIELSTPDSAGVLRERVTENNNSQETNPLRRAAN